MKVALLLFLFICLVCSTMALFWDYETKQPKSIWGKPGDGIQAMIYPTRPICKVGQQCEIRLKLRNSGKHRRILDSHTYITGKHWINWQLYGELIGDMKLSEEPNIILEPGQVVDLPYDKHILKRIGIHGYLAHLSMFGGIKSNKITIYMIPGNRFWITLIMLQLVGISLLYITTYKRTAQACDYPERSESHKG